MKTITVTCVWRTTHVIEVPADFEIPSTLGEFPEDALDEMTSQNAELVDWY